MAEAKFRVTWQRASLAVWDVICWLAATLLFVGARYNFSLGEGDWKYVLVYLVGAISMQLLGGYVTKIYRGRHHVGSFEEALTIGLLAAAIAVVLGIGSWALAPSGFPLFVVLTVPIGALMLMGAGRFAARAYFTRHLRDSASPDAIPVLVYGAGNAGQQFGRIIQNDKDAPYEIVGYIDDDPTKQNLHLGPYKVLGDRSSMVTLAADFGVKTIVMSMPTATRQLLREVSKITDREGLDLLVMPGTKDIVGGRVNLAQLHRIDMADLLGRRPINTDIGAIAGYLKGRTVLVTGAGGSIGSEIARQVSRFEPRELVMLDRDESLLHSTQLSIFGHGMLDTPNMVLADIRDPEALEEVFATHKPDVVFHAAALKHLPMLQQYPAEGWKTNVLGTKNVLDVATKHGVKRFVNISTDKAAAPTSVLGKTKRIAEELTAWYAQETGATYLSVRFGNVLGSRGSVLWSFTAQIEKGGPVTVTDPNVTRYFMTIPEACELVIQAAAIGQPGDVLVLDMGEPVRILEVAEGLIARSGKDIDIVFTGLRDGEKLDEVLYTSDEVSDVTSHPLITRITVPPLTPDQLAGMDCHDVAGMGALATVENTPALPAAATLN
jgi:FlaA1/EpsC-like NDP-sugar epimerase